MMAAEFELPRTKHAREISIDGKIHNDKMGRMNGSQAP